MSPRSLAVDQTVMAGRSLFTIHRYLPVILIYFFFNTMGLPHGLLYTSVLVPFFYLWLLKNGVRFILARYFIALTPFAVFHVKNGVVAKDYVVSSLLLLTIYVSGYAIYFGVKRIKQLDQRFLTVIYLNFAMAVLALLLKNTPYAGLMWREKDVITAGLEGMMRLQMFVYEPSYYSTLLVPLFLYAYFRCLHSLTRKNVGLLLMVTIPLLMSYSFGVITGLALALGLIHLVYLKKIVRLNRRYIFFLPLIVAVLLIVVMKGSFAQRLANVATGLDTSGQARTIFSYIFAYDIASLKSLWWGAGLGQPKFLGLDIIAKLNQFWADNDTHLPCAVAETLATFGFIGLFLKIGAELYLFIKTRVFANYYRLALFLFIFIYQFTGSYLTNITEYVIWILSFSQIFPELDISPRYSAQIEQRRSKASNLENLSGAAT